MKLHENICFCKSSCSHHADVLRNVNMLYIHCASVCILLLNYFSPYFYYIMNKVYHISIHTEILSPLIISNQPQKWMCTTLVWAELFHNLDFLSSKIYKTPLQTDTTLFWGPWGMRWSVYVIMMATNLLVPIKQKVNRNPFSAKKLKRRQEFLPRLPE